MIVIAVSNIFYSSLITPNGTIAAVLKGEIENTKRRNASNTRISSFVFKHILFKNFLHKYLQLFRKFLFLRPKSNK